MISSPYLYRSSEIKWMEVEWTNERKKSKKMRNNISAHYPLLLTRIVLLVSVCLRMHYMNPVCTMEQKKNLVRIKRGTKKAPNLVNLFLCLIQLTRLNGIYYVGVVRYHDQWIYSDKIAASLKVGELKRFNERERERHSHIMDRFLHVFFISILHWFEP